MRTRLTCPATLRPYAEADCRAMAAGFGTLLHRLGLPDPACLAIRVEDNPDPAVGPTSARTDRSAAPGGTARVSVVVGADLIRVDLRRIFAHEMCHVAVALACGAPAGEYACLAHEYLAERLCWELQSHAPDDADGVLRSEAADVSDFFSTWAMPTHLGRTAARIRAGAHDGGRLPDTAGDGILNGVVNAVYARGKADALRRPDAFAAVLGRVHAGVADAIAGLCAPLFEAAPVPSEPLAPAAMRAMLASAEDDAAMSDAVFEGAWARLFEAMSSDAVGVSDAPPVPGWVSALLVRRPALAEAGRAATPRRSCLTAQGGDGARSREGRTTCRARRRR